MNTIKNKKGFTLIELLAVIVVLAIVMVLATTTVLPYMADARKKAFAIEAGDAITAAQEAMTLKLLGSITPEQLSGDGYVANEETGVYCFSIGKLVDLGIWQKDKKDIYEEKNNEKGTYEGYVLVETSKPEPSKAYVYKVKMHNESLYVDNGDGGKVENDKVEDWSKSSNSKGTFTCPAS